MAKPVPIQAQPLSEASRIALRLRHLRGPNGPLQVLPPAAASASASAKPDDKTLASAKRVALRVMHATMLTTGPRSALD